MSLVSSTGKYADESHLKTLSSSSSGARRMVSVDNVLFGCEGTQLKVLLIKHASGKTSGRWGLPGDWLRDDETLERAAIRVLRARTGLGDIHLEQLQSFSSIDRYPDDLTITTAFYALIRPDDYQLALGEDELEVKWFPIADTPVLIFDHGKILKWALARLRYKTQHEPVGLNLLPEKFTLLELQKLYEAILGTSFDKPNFRRKIMKAGLLLDCNEKQLGGAHRAASLFKFNPSRYKQLSEEGFMRYNSII
mgnify:CR=1 FL=1